MAIVTRRYVNLGISQNALNSVFQFGSVTVNASRVWAQIQYDDATADITIALDEFMASYGFVFDNDAGKSGIRVRQDNLLGTPIDIRVDADGNIYAVGFSKSPIISVSSPATAASTGLAETIAFEWNVNLAQLGATIIPSISGLMSRTVAGATATFNLRVGGTIGVADGTIIAAITATGALSQKKNVGVSFANPAGINGDLVKITTMADNILGVATIRGTTVTFRPA